MSCDSPQEKPLPSATVLVVLPCIQSKGQQSEAPHAESSLQVFPSSLHSLVSHACLGSGDPLGNFSAKSRKTRDRTIRDRSRPTPHPSTHRGPSFFHSAHKRLLTLQDVALREAVESLGADRHRFVLCELKDGRSRVGGI